VKKEGKIKNLAQKEAPQSNLWQSANGRGDAAAAAAAAAPAALAAGRHFCVFRN